MMLSLFSILSNRSNQWSKVRAEHLKKQPICQACGSKKDLDVHHIEPVSVNPNRELDPSNLITLCSKYCHLAIGHLMDTKSWNENVIEDAKVYYNKVCNRPYKIVAQNQTKNKLFNKLLFLFKLN